MKFVIHLYTKRMQNHVMPYVRLCSWLGALLSLSRSQIIVTKNYFNQVKWQDEKSPLFKLIVCYTIMYFTLRGNFSISVQINTNEKRTPKFCSCLDIFRFSTICNQESVMVAVHRVSYLPCLYPDSWFRGRCMC